MKLDNQKKIIIVSIAFFLLSAVYLSFMETRQADLNAGKNWWSLSFADPKSNNLNFTIENHSQKNNFHWQIMDGTEKLQEGDINIANGAMKNIDLSNFKTSWKITIDITSGSDKKEIYKILP